jgi:ATP-dependent DNA ligase
MASSASSFNLCVADRITFFGRNRRMARSPRPTTVAAANAGLPAWVKPQLTQLVTEAPGGDEWAHELKFDGYRMHARLDRGDVCLLTRTGLDWTGKYPAIAAALTSLPTRQAYLDGELRGVRPDGVTSFLKTACRLTRAIRSDDGARWKTRRRFGRTRRNNATIRDIGGR